jgi:hypothetical protein
MSGSFQGVRGTLDIFFALSVFGGPAAGLCASRGAATHMLRLREIAHRVIIMWCFIWTF